MNFVFWKSNYRGTLLTNLISYHSVLKLVKSFKVTVTKEKVSNFSAEHIAHWSTHGLVVTVLCLQAVKEVENPHSIRLKRHSKLNYEKILSLQYQKS